MTGQVAVWSIGVGSFLAALVAVPVGLVTAVLGSRVMVLALSGLFASRRYREVAGVVLMLVVSAGAVSYTHLDVYKRQTPERSTMRPPSAAQEPRWASQPALQRNCLLYTSRCV